MSRTHTLRRRRLCQRGIAAPRRQLAPCSPLHFAATHHLLPPHDVDIIGRREWPKLQPLLLLERDAVTPVVRRRRKATTVYRFHFTNKDDEPPSKDDSQLLRCKKSQAARAECWQYRTGLPAGAPHDDAAVAGASPRRHDATRRRWPPASRAHEFIHGILLRAMLAGRHDRPATATTWPSPPHSLDARRRYRALGDGASRARRASEAVRRQCRRRKCRSPIFPF